MSGGIGPPLPGTEGAPAPAPPPVTAPEVRAWDARALRRWARRHDALAPLNRVLRLSLIHI